jgi:uncharacterized membrane protein
MTAIPAEVRRAHLRRIASADGGARGTAAAFAGAALVVRGVTRRDLPGWLAVAAGSALLVRGAGAHRNARFASERAQLAAGNEPGATLEVARSITVGERPERILSLLREVDRWLPGARAERVPGEPDRWRVSLRLGPRELEWNVRLRSEGERALAWTAGAEGEPPSHGGRVSLRPTADERGTELRVSVDLGAESVLVRLLGRTFRSVAERVIGVALHRFRQVLETGEVVRNDPQPHGPRGFVARLAHAGGEPS